MKTKKMLNIEEALGVIRSFGEHDERGREKIEHTLHSSIGQTVFSDLLAGNYIAVSGDTVTLTNEGERIARDVTRRHRLAERLLADVVEISGSAVDEIACEFEHILSSDVEDAICTLLGHPKVCPHGSAIPPGECCRKAAETTSPIVLALDHLEAGEKARIAYIVTSEHPYLHKLLSMGIVPGTEILLHQKSPSYVIIAGETQIALDKDVASQIYVRKI